MYTHEDIRLLLYWNVRGGHAALTLAKYHNNGSDDLGKEILGEWSRVERRQCVRVPIVAHAPPTHWHARVHSVVLFTRAQRNLLIVCTIWSLDYQ
jgi:hypothetical protein